ncbi:MAG: ribosomal protein S18-alanine N-acetyltransferase [Gemmatimonadales bacterium]
MDGLCRLRQASSADIPAFAQLELASFSDPWTTEQLRTALTWPGAVVMAAELSDGSVAGYVLGRVIVDEGEILTIATDPTRRRTGIGRALLTAALAAMVQRGAHAVWLEVRASNEAARQMYQHAGFVAAGLRKGYYRRPVEDALVLRRDLSPSAFRGAEP